VAPRFSRARSSSWRATLRRLGEFVKSLDAEGSRIMDALDELLTRASG